MREKMLKKLKGLYDFRVENAWLKLIFVGGRRQIWRVGGLFVVVWAVCRYVR